jgi:RimJ/RimL family protein N-acetyltransferase
MSWRFTDDVDAYAAAVGPLLGASPVEHTLSLTIIENARARGGTAAETFGWWTEPAGEVTGAVSHTSPHELVLGVVPDVAVRPLVRELGGLATYPTGVNGPTATAAQVAAVWMAETGGAALLRHAERLHALEGAVHLEAAPPGRARVATTADVDLLVRWIEDFCREAGVAAHPPTVVEDRLDHGGMTVWDDASGEPVALAARNRPAAGIVRVGPVFTPAPRRRRGWGAAVTAAATQAALDEGAGAVVLFTDLTNATSNALYRRLGYRPVGDRLVLRFDVTPPA